MKSKVRFRGKLRSYLCWPLWLTIPMTIADVGLYFYDVTAGFLLTVFIVVYFVLELGLYYNTRPRLANEIINFATQYATVQKKLLNEFEIPYALLDYTGKILWVNERFSELTGVGRNYHKSITTLFSNITREFLQKHEDAQNITIEKKERIFRISLNRIYFDDIMEESKEIDVKDSDEFLTWTGTLARTFTTIDMHYCATVCFFLQTIAISARHKSSFSGHCQQISH